MSKVDTRTLEDALDGERNLIDVTTFSVKNDDKRVLQFPDEWFTVMTPLRGSFQIEGQDGPGRRSVILKPGEISKLAPGNPVQCLRAPQQRLRAEMACIHVSTRVVLHAMGERPADGVAPLHTLQVFDPHLASMAPALIRTLPSGGRYDFAISAAYYLAALLTRPHSDTPVQAGGLSGEQVTAVTRYMHEFIGADITLDDLAKQALLSRYHFIRRFTAATGKTPFRYLTDLRIDAARQALTVGSEPVSQVGRRYGFPSAANFTRVFRRYVGCSPSQYRQRLDFGPELCSLGMDGVGPAPG